MKHLSILICLLLVATCAYGQTRCVAIKKDGGQCRNIVQGTDTLCYAHNRPVCGHIKKDGTPCRINILPCKYHDNVMTCGHIKKDGTPCRMRVNNAGGKCHYHAD